MSIVSSVSPAGTPVSVASPASSPPTPANSAPTQAAQQAASRVVEASLRAVVDPEQSKKELEVVIANLNEQMQSTGRRLGFEYDPRTDRPVVSVFNRQTGELVRQIPNEVVLRVANSIEELKGVLFDERF